MTMAVSGAASLGAMRALKEAGVAIPAEVAFAGFDDLDWADLYVLRCVLVCSAERDETVTCQSSMLASTIRSSARRCLAMRRSGGAMVRALTCSTS